MVHSLAKIVILPGLGRLLQVKIDGPETEVSSLYYIYFYFYVILYVFIFQCQQQPDGSWQWDRGVNKWIWVVEATPAPTVAPTRRYKVSYQ